MANRIVGGDSERNLGQGGHGSGGRVSATRFSPLHRDLASRILAMMRDSAAPRGHHLVEQDLCEQLGVSRTPVRGALRLLEERRVVEARPHRGYYLRAAVAGPPVDAAIQPDGAEEKMLLTAIAAARRDGSLPDRCSEQEIAHILGNGRAPVARAMQQLAELGLAERRPGSGWAFVRLRPGQDGICAESHAFRAMVEPAGLLERGFRLDPRWLERSRTRHAALRRRQWTVRLAAELADADAEFHEQLARFSGNRHVLDAVRRQNRLRHFVETRPDEGAERALEAIDEHLAILDALGSGEAELASRLLRTHLDNERPAGAGC